MSAPARKLLTLRRERALARDSLPRSPMYQPHDLRPITRRVVAAPLTSVTASCTGKDPL